MQPENKPKWREAGASNAAMFRMRKPMRSGPKTYNPFRTLLLPRELTHATVEYQQLYI